MPEPPRTNDPLPLVIEQDGYVYVGCEHNPNPSIKTPVVPGEDILVTALRGVWHALCRDILQHTGRDERPLEADGSERWYVFQNEGGRVCSRDGCHEVHPYLMVEHVPYADTQPISPLEGCPAVPAEPGMQVVIREVKEGVQTEGYRGAWIYRLFQVP